MEYAIKIKGLYLVKTVDVESHRLVNKLKMATHLNDIHSAYNEIDNLVYSGVSRDDMEIVKYQRFSVEDEVDNGEPITYTMLFEKKELDEKEINDFLDAIRSFDGKSKELVDRFMTKFIKDTYPHVVSLKGYEYLFKELEKYYLDLLSIDKNKKEPTAEEIQEHYEALDDNKATKVQTIAAVFNLLNEYRSEEMVNLKKTLKHLIR